MKKLLFAILITFSTFSVFAQDEKNLVYDPNASARTVESFNKIEVYGSIDVYLSQGKEEAVVVSANNEELTARIKTEVIDGVLHIYFRDKGFSLRSWTGSKMKAYVTFTELSSLKIASVSSVKATQPIKVDNLSMIVSGASSFSGEVHTAKLNIDVSGASSIKISGRAQETTISVSGASSVKGYDLKTDDCTVDASGASAVRITVKNELSASASGASSINYKGEAVIKTVDTSGGSSIKKRTEE